MIAPDARILAAQVAAWHNRHPLARRITAEHVKGIGVVSLPFLAANSVQRAEPVFVPDGEKVMSLRERALAQAGTSAQPAPTVHANEVSATRQTPRRAADRAFDEEFIAPISPRRAAAFAARHGADGDPSGGTWPCRQVLVAARRAGVPMQSVFVRTAAIEVDDRRVRVLLSARGDGSFAAAGPRIYSMPRVGSTFGALCVVAVLGFALGQRGAPPVVAEVAAVVVQPAPLSAPAQPHPQTAPQAVPQPQPQPQTVPQHTPHPPPVREDSSPPADIRPLLAPDVARQARRESEVARAVALRAPLPGTASEREASAEPATAAAPELAPDDSGKTFALVARQTRSRAASQVLLGLMQTTATRDAQPNTRTGVLPSGDGYRASWWPFATRQDAERAREHLALVGLPVELVEF